MTQEYLTRAEGALWLQARGYPISARTLAKYASIGGGPEFQKFGTRVLYRPEKLLEWARSRTSEPLAISQ